MYQSTTTKSIGIVLLLLSIIIVTVIQQTPFVDTKVYAQDDDEKEEDKDEKQQDEEPEQEEQEQTEEPETSDEYIKLQEQINATNQEQQQIKNELSNLLANISSTAQQQQEQEPQPQIPIYPNPYLPPPEPEPISAAEECDCTKIENNTLIPLPPPVEPPEPTAATISSSSPPSPVVVEEEQIPITPQDIKFAKAIGEITDPSYTNFYHLGNLFDNKVDDNISYWSQFGNANFMIQFKHPIQDYNVCSVQVYTHNPKDSPFVLSVGSSSNKNITGNLDDSIKIITLDKCVQNVNKIKMSFDADQKFTTLSELKLFGVSAAKKPTKIPPTTPVLEPPQQQQNKNNKTKIMIKNSNADISILNSTVDFKFDSTSGVRANNYDIITIPNTAAAVAAAETERGIN